MWHLKTIMIPPENWAAFYYYHALVILNNAGNKLVFLPGQTAHTVHYLHRLIQFDKLRRGSLSVYLGQFSRAFSETGDVPYQEMGAQSL